MTVPSDPPVAVTPVAFRTWAQDVSDTAQDHETRIDTLETIGDDQTAAQVAFTPAGTVAATDVQAAIVELDSEKATVTQAKTETLIVAVGDETTTITTGTAKVTFRMPYAMTLAAVRASLTTESSSGIPTFDINENGTSILSTKLTIDASERTSSTAATPAVISDTALADDAEITVDIDVAGTGAKGPKVYLFGTRA